jgi:osmoprotectant transport system substrate-binding protein
MARLGVLLVVLSCAVAGCGSSSEGSPAREQPGKGKPMVTLGTKNFTEQYILGELYAQALRAKGFSVDVKQDIGSSEVIDRAMTAGSIDLYPEYIGVTVQEIARERRRPRTSRETYERAKAFQEKRGYTLLDMTPGFDAAATAVKPELARRHDLESTGDLRRLGRFRYGGPAENRTRFQGAVGLRRVYGLTGMRYVGLEIPDRYPALDRGKVDAITVFSTEGQLAERNRYVVLTDPENIFGFQNIAPVVSPRLLSEQGPALRRTLDAVSALLTNDALRSMNAAVDLRHQPPRDVAERFLRAHDLL